MVKNGCPCFFNNYVVIVAITTICVTMTTLWVSGELYAESCGDVKLVAQMHEMVKNSCPWFFNNSDVIVAITTVCATMATHWLGGELNAESYGSVELVAQT